jgi:hypothetical protein
VSSNRAPRHKKRISCELTVGDSQYAGIVLDLSATGMWVQMNAKISQKSLSDSKGVVTVNLTLVGSELTTTVKCRVARMKTVPPQFLGLQHGGIGVVVIEPSDDFLEMVASLSPEQADAVEVYRKLVEPERLAARPAADLPKPFRVHVVETNTAEKKTYIAMAASEEQASAEVVAQLGDAFQVLFVERI